MACHLCSTSLATCRHDPSGRPVDRSTDNRSARAAPRASLESPHSVSQTIQIIPLSQISVDLQHAVVAAEDARFFQHHGFDWHEVQIAAEDDLEGGRTRGASTITQQLVKNLFFGTGRSFLRKGAEFTLVPVAEVVLGKRRILEIYLNVVEWGSGMYGAESACRYYDGTAARNVGREQAARLAAILPAPLKRRPERMNNYSTLILNRMRAMGW
jgi:monofunctional biosynthetic peptidoglycan transglycosylase